MSWIYILHIYSKKVNAYMNNILLLSNCNGKMFKISKMQGNITLCRKQVKRGYFYSFFDI